LSRLWSGCLFHSRNACPHTSSNRIIAVWCKCGSESWWLWILRVLISSFIRWVFRCTALLTSDLARLSDHYLRNLILAGLNVS
jgi:hypothetical protein